MIAPESWGHGVLNIQVRFNVTFTVPLLYDHILDLLTDFL